MSKLFGGSPVDFEYYLSRKISDFSSDNLMKINKINEYINKKIIENDQIVMTEDNNINNNKCFKFLQYINILNFFNYYYNKIFEENKIYIKDLFINNNILAIKCLLREINNICIKNNILNNNCSNYKILIHEIREDENEININNIINIVKNIDELNDKQKLRIQRILLLYKFNKDMLNLKIFNKILNDTNFVNDPVFSEILKYYEGMETFSKSIGLEIDHMDEYIINPIDQCASFIGKDVNEITILDLIKIHNKLYKQNIN